MFKDRQLQLPNKFVILGGTLLIGCLLVCVFIPKESQKNENTSSAFISDPKGKVFIGDPQTYLNTTTRESVERTLYIHLDKKGPELYTGTIRPGSFNTETPPSGQTIKKLLIDVEPVKLTYSVILTGDDDVYSVNLRCASQEQQMNPSNICRDMLPL